MRRLDEILGQIRTETPSASGGPLADQPTTSTDEPSDEEVCPLCGGAGFVRRDVALGHPDFGRAFPCQCVLDEREDERLARLQRYSNLGPLTRLTFDTLISRGRSASRQDQERFQQCVEDARAFAAEPEGWLVLSGPSGCGKTHIAAAIANACIARGQPALFMVVPDLLDHLRAAYDPASDVGYDELFELVRNAPLLILDDLGTQSSTAWAQEKLFQLINHRFNARLPLVVTTALRPDQLDDRLRTRLTEPSLSRVYQLEAGHRAGYRRLDVLDLPRFRNMTFESFDTRGFDLRPDDRGRLENAYRCALEFAQKPENWLLLAGPSGGGKTHLAVAIANYRRQLGDMPYFVMVTELLHFLRYGRENQGPPAYHQEVDEIRNVPLLILDDLDYRGGNPWWEELYQILSFRFSARLPTVITTSQTLANISLDDRGERLASLLRDPTVCSEVPVPSSLPPVETPVAQQKRGRGRPRQRRA
jgi:DNA replication protein DnaC